MYCWHRGAAADAHLVARARTGAASAAAAGSPQWWLAPAGAGRTRAAAWPPACGQQGICFYSYFYKSRMWMPGWEPQPPGNEIMSRADAYYCNRSAGSRGAGQHPPAGNAACARHSRATRAPAWRCPAQRAQQGEESSRHSQQPAPRQGGSLAMQATPAMVRHTEGTRRHRGRQVARPAPRGPLHHARPPGHRRRLQSPPPAAPTPATCSTAVGNAPQPSRVPPAAPAAGPGACAACSRGRRWQPSAPRRGCPLPGGRAG